MNGPRLTTKSVSSKRFEVEMKCLPSQEKSILSTAFFSTDDNQFLFLVDYFNV